MPVDLIRHTLRTLIAAAAAACVAAAPAVAQVPGDDSMGFDYPRAYDDDATGRFWDYAEKLLGSRIGYTAETNQNPKSVTLEIGAVGMGERDRRALRAAVPGPWVKLHLFETRYSMADLNGFGERAQEALRDAGLAGLWTSYAAAPLGDPNRVHITIAQEDFRARAVLQHALPDDAYVVEIGQFSLALPDVEESPLTRRRPAALLITASVALVIAVAAKATRRVPGTATHDP